MKKLSFCYNNPDYASHRFVQAGKEVYKQVAPPPPPPMYALGFYGAIDMGANIYQDRGETRTFNG